MQITTLQKDDVKRGEIYYISRGGYNTGSEQQADRPGVIVSNDKNNKRHIESAVSEEEELKEEQYDVFRGESAHLGSVRRSKMKTAMMIANIDRAMEELRAEYETKEMVYKYDAFKMHYIDGVPYEEIADIQNCGKNTPSRWSKELIRKMSVRLFGIDGVEKY